MNTLIYLDNAATTRVDPHVVEKMLPHLGEGYGNPSSNHVFGRQAATAVMKSRQQVADLVNVDPNSIIWTSGATEAINLAVKGAAYARSFKGNHIITCQTEHSAVLDSCRYLEANGFDVTYLAPEKNGLLDIEKLTAALTPATILVSLMQVNNEIGVIQNIDAISQLTSSHGIVFHVDAAQSAGKIPIDLNQSQVDLMSFSAHKIYGPKGIGALYARPSIQLQPLIHGGDQEQGLRSGTLATHQIVGMGEAFAIAKQVMQQEAQQVSKLRDFLWQGLRSLGNVQRNGDETQCVAGILNVTFVDISNEMLLPAIREIAVSTGSACHSAKPQPSHVLKAIGLTDELANSSIRFSLGRFTTLVEIDYVINKINEVVKTLCQL